LDENNQLSYDYWVGTSFAAPLVSGLAALVLDAGFEATEVSDDGQTVVGRGWVPADEVYDSIENCAAPSDGIINVPCSVP
jgi:subtilisin family serine protease